MNWADPAYAWLCLLLVPAAMLLRRTVRRRRLDLLQLAGDDPPAQHPACRPVLGALLPGTAVALVGRVPSHAIVYAKGKVSVPSVQRLHAKTAASVAKLGLAEVPVAPFVGSDVQFLTADLEDRYSIAQANSPINENGEFSDVQVTVRREERFQLVRPDRVDFMDVDPKQIVSVSTSLIPFLEHDDANRALMGSSMLRPGVPGLSEKIHVRSIIGRFLEHHRIFYFLADGKENIYLSSADWMERNFFKRIELAFPILDPKLKKRVITEGLKFYLADNQQGWEMNSAGAYQRRRSARAKPHNAQGELMLTLGMS